MSTSKGAWDGAIYLSAGQSPLQLCATGEVAESGPKHSVSLSITCSEIRAWSGYRLSRAWNAVERRALEKVGFIAEGVLRSAQRREDCSE